MKQGIWMGRDAAILKLCFPHPTPRSGAQRESAAGAFGHVVSDGGYAMKYPAIALAKNPAALVLSQGKLVLGAGQGAFSELLTNRDRVRKEERAYRIDEAVLLCLTREKKVLFGPGRGRVQEKSFLSTQKYHEDLKGFWYKLMWYKHMRGEG